MLKNLIDKIRKFSFQEILVMNIGLILCAISATVFINSSGIVVGGGVGLTIFIERLTGIPYYYLLYAMNGFLILMAFILLGKSFTIKTIYGSIMLPTYSMVLQWIFNALKFDIGSIIIGVDPIFIVLFASLSMGVGIGLNMRLGGSTGGFDIIEAIALKYLHIPYSTSIYALDAVVVILGMVYYDPTTAIFTNWFAEGLAAVSYVFILGVITDIISFGGLNKRAVFIRSDKYEEIRNLIINKLVRGLTYLDAEGGYSFNQTKMIVTICYSKEYFILRDEIQKIDPNAFIFVTYAAEVRGLGFNFETPEHKQRHTKHKSV